MYWLEIKSACSLRHKQQRLLRIVGCLWSCRGLASTMKDSRGIAVIIGMGKRPSDPPPPYRASSMAAEPTEPTTADTGKISKVAVIYLYRKDCTYHCDECNMFIAGTERCS